MVTVGGVIPDSVTALVWHGGQDLRLESFAVPDLGVGDLLVRVDLAAICGSDRHTVTGRRPGPSPSVLGHEAIGRVVAAGPEAPATVDQRVVWGVAKSCFDCDRCASGRTVKCRSLIKTGHAATSAEWGPLSGDYATHIVIPRGVAVVAVPDEVSDEEAAISPCAMATVAACIEAAGDVGGKRVAVIGAGMLGVCATAWSAHLGASHVVALDALADRAKQSLRFGASAEATEFTAADGQFDVIFEVSGAESAINDALSRLDLGGTLVLAGSVCPSEPIMVDPERVVRQWLTLRGVHNYEPRHLQQAIDFLATSDYPWTDVMSKPMSLKDASSELGQTHSNDDSERTILRALVNPHLPN